MLAKALARSIDCSVRRMQFTPDLLPSDITGVSVYNQDVRDFEFRPGRDLRQRRRGRRDQPRLAQDPVGAAGVAWRRARSPSTARPTTLPSAVHGDRHPEPDRDGGHLPAARGPARPLHGARLDGLPLGRAPSWRCSTATAASRRWTTLSPVTDAATRCPALIEAVRRVYTSDAVKQYVVDLVAATRRSPALRLGASPRATPAPAAGRPGPRRARRAATTCCPTTCRRSPSRCWRTGSSPRERPSSPGARTGDVLRDLMRRVPVPAP